MIPPCQRRAIATWLSGPSSGSLFNPASHQNCN
jgi:hypothetical protein